MALKRHNRADVTEDQAEALARRLADKPYGGEKEPEDTLARTTISLPGSLLVKMENTAIANKRARKGPKNVSALIRIAVERYLSEL